jgi:hypothetical protein
VPFPSAPPTAAYTYGIPSRATRDPPRALLQPQTTVRGQNSEEFIQYIEPELRLTFGSNGSKIFLATVAVFLSDLLRLNARLRKFLQRTA